MSFSEKHSSNLNIHVHRYFLSNVYMNRDSVDVFYGLTPLAQPRAPSAVIHWADQYCQLACTLPNSDGPMYELYYCQINGTKRYQGPKFTAMLWACLIVMAPTHWTNQSYQLKLTCTLAGLLDGIGPNVTHLTEGINLLLLHSPPLLWAHSMLSPAV